MSQKPAEPAWKNFAQGGLGAMTASCVTHPFDLLKVRLQIQGELATKGAPKLYNGVVDAAKYIVRNDGIRALYTGLSASLMRQLTFSSVRFGVYDQVKAAMITKPKEVLPTWKLMLAGGTAGALGACAGTPADIVLVRMLADGKEPPEKRRNYKHVFDGWRRIVAEEGVGTLWKGVGPTVNRAILVTIAQLVSYDIFKQLLVTKVGMKDGLPVHFSSSLLAGMIAAVATSPVDVIKTRIQNQKPVPVTLANGQVVNQLMYRSSLDCLVKTVKAEGPMGLYKGFIPTYVRLGPHTIVMFMAFEQYKKLFSKF